MSTLSEETVKSLSIVGNRDIANHLAPDLSVSGGAVIGKSALVRGDFTTRGNLNADTLVTEHLVAQHGDVQVTGNVLVDEQFRVRTNSLVVSSVTPIGEAVTMNGPIDANTHTVMNLATPVNTLDAVTKQYVDAFRAIGDMKFSAQPNDHHGWLLCDGRTLNISQYSDLYAVIGVAFGTGGVNTFKLPDCRGRAIAAIGHGTALTTRALGDQTGAETMTLTTNELPAHTHTGTTTSDGAHTHSITDPGHTHTQTTINDDFNGSGANPPGFTSDSAGERTWSNINASTTGITINSAGAHTHTFTTGSTGSGVAFSLFQPTLFLSNCFIFCNVNA